LQLTWGKPFNLRIVDYTNDPDACYFEINLNGDGSPDDLIRTPGLLVGGYQIKVFRGLVRI
jgi:hypothetical protein